MHFRHPDLIDHPRCRSDFSEGAELGLRHPPEGVMTVLFVLRLVSVLAVASLAASGASLIPLGVILGGGFGLLLLCGFRSSSA